MAAAKVVQATAAQLALLDELKAAAEKTGLRVREERLLREVGYRVRSGRCRLADDQLLFIDRTLPVTAQIGKNPAGRSKGGPTGLIGCDVVKNQLFWVCSSGGR